MKVYRLTLYDQDMGAMLSWHPSRADAKAAMRRGIAFRGDPKTELDRIDPHDIPTNMAGLLEWLNREFNTDNG